MDCYLILAQGRACRSLRPLHHTVSRGDSQSSAADLVKRSMVQVSAAIRQAFPKHRGGADGPSTALSPAASASVVCACLPSVGAQPVPDSTATDAAVGTFAVDTCAAGTAASRHSLAPVRLVLQIHDELVFEVREDLVAEASRLIRTVMEAAGRTCLPSRGAATAPPCVALRYGPLPSL